MSRDHAVAGPRPGGEPPAPVSAGPPQPDLPDGELTEGEPVDGEPVTAELVLHEVGAPIRSRWQRGVVAIRAGLADISGPVAVAALTIGAGVAAGVVRQLASGSAVGSSRLGRTLTVSGLVVHRVDIVHHVVHHVVHHDAVYNVVHHHPLLRDPSHPADHPSLPS